MARCKFCGGQVARLTVRDWRFQPDAEYVYFQCLSCNCLQIAEVPANPAQYYPAHYHGFQWKPGSNRIIRIAHRVRAEYIVFRRGFVGKLLDARFPDDALRSLSSLGLTTNSRVLDIGSGTGKLLYWLNELGIHDVLGIDSQIPAPIRYSNGLRILKCELTELEEGEWDVIMLHHAFEHMPDQPNVLRLCLKLLAPGGLCLIRTPVVPSFAWTQYGSYWVQWDAPRHLVVHSPESLTNLASQAGFDLVRIVYDSTAFQFWGSEQYKRGIPLESAQSYLNNRRAFAPGEIAAFGRMAQQLNLRGQGDQAAFYFQKRLPSQPAARTSG